MVFHIKVERLEKFFGQARVEKVKGGRSNGGLLAKNKEAYRFHPPVGVHNNPSTCSMGLTVLSSTVRKIFSSHNFLLFMLKPSREYDVDNGPVEKMAFFDASDLYALNPQQEALNCIIFIFSDL